jgi:hypothetical protein
MRHISTIEPVQCTTVLTGDYKCLGEVNILVLYPIATLLLSAKLLEVMGGVVN